MFVITLLKTDEKHKLSFQENRINCNFCKINIKCISALRSIFYCTSSGNLRSTTEASFRPFQREYIFFSILEIFYGLLYNFHIHPSIPHRYDFNDFKCYSNEVKKTNFGFSPQVVPKVANMVLKYFLQLKNMKKNMNNLQQQQKMQINHLG